jgi:hypothetical protein
MTPTTFTSRVGADGILSVSIPLSPSDANLEVRVTVESVNPKPKMTQDEWKTWLGSLAGRWQGEFERPDQGEFEQRDALL